MFIARNIAFYWAPVAIWMFVIFGASGDAGSVRHSSRILEPLIRWLFPNASDHDKDAIIFFARKCAHVTEYALLALMFWRSVCRPAWKAAEKWNWDGFFVALWLAMFYAATDEFHQTYVPAREGCIRDVAIDSFGALLALLVLYGLSRLPFAWPRRTWVVGACMAPWVLLALVLIHWSGLW